MGDNLDRTSVVEWFQVKADSDKEAQKEAFASLSAKHALESEELKQWQVVVLQKQP
ncbi:MAG: hypothetical protein GDA43_06800 [Hormoscilla sp. SP5CHS1]|nr:hypothetical protein [Hormoscilla sp. SP12CHS1]MBC6452947.1 hypothetical protein [Hormoscilla sp. SP5CHS1]MBC6475977.1 hypothetical protein [Hormoscilla sp. GM102CHS1]